MNNLDKIETNEIEKVCKYCGEPEGEHCIFEPGFSIPKGCQCDVQSWHGASEITPICKQFNGKSNRPCSNCEHNEGCHS